MDLWVHDYMLFTLVNTVEAPALKEYAGYETNSKRGNNQSHYVQIRYFLYQRI